MTTPRETRQLVEIAYRQWPHIEPDEMLATLWHHHLHEIPLPEAARAVSDVLATAKYPPTIADVLERIATPGASPGLPLITAETRWELGEGARERMDPEQLQENLRRTRQMLKNTFRVVPGEAS